MAKFVRKDGRPGNRNNALIPKNGDKDLHPGFVIQLVDFCQGAGKRAVLEPNFLTYLQIPNRWIQHTIRAAFHQHSDDRVSDGGGQEPWRAGEAFDPAGRINRPPAAINQAALDETIAREKRLQTPDRLAEPGNGREHLWEKGAEPLLAQVCKRNSRFFPMYFNDVPIS